IVTCAATSGFMMEFDNRHFWMRLKNLVGSHFANYQEAWQANRLLAKGMIHPVMSQVFPLQQVGEAAYQVHNNMHEGKLGVLCLAPEPGLGVTDPGLRAKIGEAAITRFQRA
ncbi:MAG: crotonyl-CoA carboxylase/reductase, partial [Actinomycetota bacterium]